MPGFPGICSVHDQLSAVEDDHPYADIHRGESFLNAVYEAVTSSPNWPETVMVINYDEWAGSSTMCRRRMGQSRRPTRR